MKIESELRSTLNSMKFNGDNKEFEVNSLKDDGVDEPELSGVQIPESIGGILSTLDLCSSIEVATAEGPSEETGGERDPGIIT